MRPLVVRCEWSSIPVNVTKQNPVVGDHSFTLLSPPAIAITEPAGEYANACTSAAKCPCCLRTYDSLRHSHTSSWPKEFLSGGHNPRECARCVLQLLATPGGVDFLQEKRNGKGRA